MLNSQKIKIDKDLYTRNKDLLNSIELLEMNLRNANIKTGSIFTELTKTKYHTQQNINEYNKLFFKG